MTWIGFWEGIASLFENVLFIPFDALRDLELTTWLGANVISWILLLAGAITFIYWMLKLKSFNESEESTYTFDENP
ncbi:MAG: uracil phosphoribosyltransferase [Flavobacteriaceae bacterium]|nr:uracil phosphoribosyltransferase [Flavobacteriaceae bacterium]